MDDSVSSGASSSNAGLPTGKLHTKKKATKKPKKLAPLEDANLSTKGNQMISKVKTIQHKRDLIEAVRKVAPASVSLSPALFHDITGNLKTIAIDDADVRQQLSIVEDGVNNAARRYNDLRVLCDRKASELKSKLDELDTLKLEHDGMDKMKTRDTHEARRIDALKVEIEEVENDILRSQHYRRQLEHMLARLKRNQIKFDAHMNGMEDTYRAVKKEWEECRLMRRGLDSGLARAELVYEECAERVRILRHERNRTLAVRKAELRNAHRLKRWMKERAVVKMALATELRGDLTKEEELLLRTQLKEKEEKTKRLQKANEESQRKVSLMDDAFTKIKQITGMSSLDDMVDKFSAQRTNKKNLEKEVSEVEMRLAEAKKLNIKAEQAFQERKSSGVGESESNRDTTVTVEEKIQAARHEYKITKAGSDRLHAVLVALRQGAHGLLQRVQPYVSLVDAGVFELTSAAVGNEETDTWAETMDALGTAEQVLSKMLEIIGGGDPSPTKIGTGTLDQSSSFDNFGQGFDGESEVATEAPSMTNNVRVRSRRTKRDSEDHDSFQFPSSGAFGFSKDDISLADTDDSSFQSEPTTPGLPHTTTTTPQMLNSATKDDKPGAAAAKSISEDDILNRHAVKRLSTRISAEAARKEKEEARSKKLAEKMVLCVHTGVGININVLFHRELKVKLMRVDWLTWPNSRLSKQLANVCLPITIHLHYLRM